MLRSELLPPRADRRALVDAVEEAFAQLDAGSSPAAVAPALAGKLGRPVDAEELHGWHSSVDAGEVVALLCTPPAHELRKLALTRDELVEVARRWIPTSSAYDPENEVWWTALFDANVPHPDGSDLAFHPPATHPDPTPEDVVELALAYRPIEL